MVKTLVSIKLTSFKTDCSVEPYGPVKLLNDQKQILSVEGVKHVALHRYMGFNHCGYI